MRSIGKYDLLETIAEGEAEVFLAEEIRTRLRRLVCVVGWKEDPKVPSSKDILRAFRRVAPDPPGVIIDSGQDQASRTVYLVTSYPSDPLAIESWVKAYRALTEKRTGLAPSSRPIGSEDATQGWAAESPAKAEPGPKQRKPEPVRAPEPTPAQAGEFTRLFHESGPVVAPPNNPGSPLGLAESEKPSAPGSFTREFFASVPNPPATIPQRESGSKAGEFTKFFRDGFNSPAAPPPPVEAEHFPAPSSGKRQGDFTKMFNSPLPPSNSHDLEPGFKPVFERGVLPSEPPSFDQPVRQEIRPRTPDPVPADRGGFVAPKFDGTNVDRGYAPAQNAAPPNSVRRPMWGNEGGEQSRVFNPAPAEPVVNRAPTPAGPSEFTRIISGGPRNAPPPVAAPPLPPTPPPQPAVPAFTPPAMAMPQPPAVQALPAPQISYQPPVATPQFAAPQFAAPPVAPPQMAPPQPPPPAPAPKPTNYIPLIIILNVVLVVAVALILYFALKPH